MTRMHPKPTVSELERELEALELRLDDGERRIEEATRIGADTASWEAFWIELLHTYEAVFRRLEAIENDHPALAA